MVINCEIYFFTTLQKFREFSVILKMLTISICDIDCIISVRPVFDPRGHDQIGVVIIFEHGVRLSGKPRNNANVEVRKTIYTSLDTVRENLLAVTWWVILNSLDLCSFYYTYLSLKIQRALPYLT